MFPGSKLGETTVQPVPRGDGTTDFCVAREPFHDTFCTIEIPGASHHTLVSHPGATAHLILEAAAMRVAA
jgi:hypothetical protein